MNIEKKLKTAELTQAQKNMFRKRSGVFKAANFYFDPTEVVATSYNWWVFVKKIKGKVVFNDYNYSNSTAKHQSKARSLIHKLGIKPALVISAPKGLQDLESAIACHEALNRKLLFDMERPRSHKAKNKERAKQIKENLKTIKAIKELMKGGK